MNDISLGILVYANPKIAYIAMTPQRIATSFFTECSLLVKFIIPYAAKIEKKIPKRTVHLWGTKVGISGNTIHEKDKGMQTSNGIFSKLIFNTLNPIIPVGIRKPFMVTKMSNRFSASEDPLVGRVDWEK